MNRLPQDSHMYGPGARDSSRFPEPYNLYQFYSEVDGPWIPLSVIQPADTLSTKSLPSAPVYNGGSGAFQDYRSAGLPSECDTAPEDSGYGGSRPTYSTVESVASINDNDRCTETGYLETQTTEQLIGDLTLSSTTPIFKASEMTNQQDQDVKYPCDQCNAFVKTKAELRKHKHRHDRPYKCNYPDCPKADRGFSTPNDLTRHKRTVHHELTGNGPVYVCRHDPCSRKEKVWPRADNFRSHLSRSHSISLKADADLRIYRYHSGTAEPDEFPDGRSPVSTVNSGHPPMQLPDPPMYTCHYTSCPLKKERWSTADAFRTHLASAHNVRLKADNDLKCYHYQSETAELHALRGVGSSVADVDPRPRPRQLQDSPDLRDDNASTTASGQVKNESSKRSSLLLTLTSVSSGGGPQLTPSNILDDLQLTPVSDTQLLANDDVDMVAEDEVSLEDPETALPHNEQREETFDEEISSRAEDQEEVSGRPEPSTPQAVPSEAPIQSNPDTTQSETPEAQKTTGGSSEASGTPAEALANPLTLVSRNTSELFTLLKNIPLDMTLKDGTSEVLSFLRNIPKDLLEKALKNEDQVGNESDPSSDQMDQHKASSTCQECGKLFSRMCELRKHMKRHEKPYGCTYKMCNKAFGSKNDWKRHESSQHFQLESWSCDFSGCNKVLPRRELFKIHLQNHHKLQDSQIIENKLESRRLGRHCDPRFWCGFCDEFIEIKEQVVNSWTKRCDHIDSHLFGKDGMEKKSMNEWCYLEDKLAEGDPQASKKRKATEDLDARPSKRSNYIWICCRCDHIENYQTSSCCMESSCAHSRCNNCTVERIPELDHETEPVSQEEER